MQTTPKQTAVWVWPMGYGGPKATVASLVIFFQSVRFISAATKTSFRDRYYTTSNEKVNVISCSLIAILSFDIHKYFKYISFNIELAFEQQGFELCASTHTWIFFNSKSYNTTWSAVGWILRCRITDMEELYIWSTDNNLYSDFCWYFQHPHCANTTVCSKM